MKKFITLLLLSLVLFTIGCSAINKINPFKKKAKQTSIQPDERQVQFQKNDREVRQLKANRDYYIGEGFNDIGSDFSSSLEAARSKAIQDLSQRIRLEVSTDMQRTISSSSVETAGRYSSREQEIIDQKVRIYTDIVLSNLQDTHYFIDYPREGVITYIIRKSISEYEEQVRNELLANRRLISENIITANNSYNSKRYMNAVHHWRLAKEMINSLFGGVAIFYDIDGDGKENELNSFVNQRISTFYTGIELALATEREYFYDVTGRIDRMPVVLAVYKDENNFRTNVSELPLRVSVTEGKASVSDKIRTGGYGQTELRISNLDAFNDETRFRVEIDTDEINKLFSLPPLNSLSINMKKIKTMAISVTFINGNNTTTPSGLLQSIKSSVLAKGFAVTDLEFRKEIVDGNDHNTIQKSNADYFLNVYLSAGNASRVGGYDNVWSANCRGVVTLYELPRVNITASESIPAESGMAASSSGAGLNAFTKIEGTVRRTVETILNRM